MARNLMRLSAAANRNAAINDYIFVAKQLTGRGLSVPDTHISTNDSAKNIDKQTRILVDWAKKSQITIKLPEGWKQ